MTSSLCQMLLRRTVACSRPQCCPRQQPLQHQQQTWKSRAIQTSSAALANEEKKEGFFGNFFDRTPTSVEAQKTPHSNKLAARDEVMELQTHNVKPDCLEKYLAAHKNLSAFINANHDNLHCQAVGHFRVMVGDEDQYVHLWKFEDGYGGMDKTFGKLRIDPEYQSLSREIVPLLRSRHSQHMLPFSFWPTPYTRKDKHIYELRSYHLKPGTLIEWGNYWARAIRMRDYHNTEAFMGLFGEIGELYNVKHIWCYDNLEQRKEARSTVWQKPEWAGIVRNTTPLIRHMTSRIMKPMEHSPTQ